MRGRKPIPTALKIARGVPGHRALNEQEAQPSSLESLEAPDWLSDVAREEWNDKAPMLHRLGLLTEADQDAFCLYCQTFARWKEAEKKLLQFGMVVMSKEQGGFPVVSPWLHIATKAQAQAAKMLIEFGLTPSSRSRVNAKAPPAVNKQKERFFGRPRAI